MASTPIGRVVVLHKGAYVSTTVYEPLDEVLYTDGCTYRRKWATTAPAGTLPTNITHWDKVADRGAQGATGATGAQGATGATGAQGAAFAGTFSLDASGNLIVTTP
ncbi:hypothetical protein [Thiothrix sp.]|jgi:hypothetical protein|uniref:hypothetical protein n=1 Tax=Thiothrix sp. TaxID=1032 RepID=UPI00257C5CEE|nr:hypothetical protein [Thiothrix sp.]